MTDLTGVPWRTGRTLGRTMYARTGGDDWKADTEFGMLDTRELAAEACADHNAALDLAWLLDAGWIAELGRHLAPGNSPAGYRVTVRRSGDLMSVNFTGETIAGAAAKAREWAEAPRD